MKKSTSPSRIKDETQLARAESERTANQRAAADGQPLPYPNVWDILDPTKVPHGASQEGIHASYREFSKLCPPRPRIKHSL